MGQFFCNHPRNYSMKILRCRYDNCVWRLACRFFPVVDLFPSPLLSIGFAWKRSHFTNIYWFPRKIMQIFRVHVHFYVFRPHLIQFHQREKNNAAKSNEPIKNWKLFIENKICICEWDRPTSSNFFVLFRVEHTVLRVVQSYITIQSIDGKL